MTNSRLSSQMLFNHKQTHTLNNVDMHSVFEKSYFIQMNSFQFEPSKFNIQHARHTCIRSLKWEQNVIWWKHHSNGFYLIHCRIFGFKQLETSEWMDVSMYRHLIKLSFIRNLTILVFCWSRAHKLMITT